MICTKCNIEKPSTEFYRRDTKFGYRRDCRDCILKARTARSCPRDIGTKTCTKCLQEKDVSEFWRANQSKDGRQCYCKRCCFPLNKVQGEKKRRTKAQLLQQQNGKCAICGTDSPRKRSWVLDHCHSTGKIRGVLCRQCNIGIGMFFDNVEILERTIQYLKSFG